MMKKCFSGWIVISLGVLLRLPWCWNVRGALPDLTIYGPAANPHVVYRSFASNDCAVNEGCVEPGTRALLAFTTQTRNVGGADLILGNPATNSVFIFDPCHNHYHYIGFAEYRLRDTNSNLVLRGKKIGSCVEDGIPWDPQAGTTRRYDCNYQGIQKGWADIYNEEVPCQWIDITGLPAGNYILELEINPNHSILEASYSNNITQLPVVIPSQCTPVSNDNFNHAEVIPRSPFSFTTFNACSTKEVGEPNHAGDAGGHSVWYQGTGVGNSTVRLTTIGSDFDTLLAVYTGSNVTNLTLVASNDDLSFPVNKQSGLSFQAVNGPLYHIAVDGYQGAFGKVVLNINPPLNDAFKDCQSISGPTGQTNGYNIGASKEAGEPDHNADFGGHSVWYCWTAPASASFEFDTIGSDFDTLLGIYTGNSVTNLIVIASDNDAGGNLASRATFAAVSGRVYRVAVDGAGGSTGNLVLNWGRALRLTIGRTSSTSIRVTLLGGQGSYAIQRSSDLAHWMDLTTITVGGSSPYYDDAAMGSIGPRFYRARAMR